MKILGVSDANSRFLYVCTKFPAHVHDSRIFKKSLGKKFEDGFRPFDGAVLLADSAYAASDYVIKMVANQAGLLEKFYR
jgi:hypothetical protein